MNITKLVRVLERLAPLDSDTIKACLQEDSSKWESLSIQNSNLEELKMESLNTE